MGVGRQAQKGGNIYIYIYTSRVAPVVKNMPANAGRHKKMWVRSFGLEDPLEEGKAIHSSILA